MFNRCVNRIRSGFFLLAMPVLVQAAPAPSQDFWEYMNEFSDQDGEVLDPVEVDQMLNLKDAGEDSADEATEQHRQMPAKKSYQFNTVNKSSVQASSSVSGAKL